MYLQLVGDLLMKDVTSTLVCGCLTHWKGLGMPTKLYREHLHVGRLA